jgi:aryl-alcohol dehydrogenase-like predicted oxidoreductase
MEYRNLGRSGLRVSAVGLGCNNLSRPGTASESQEGATAVVSAALDAGVTFFDTADAYGPADELGDRAQGANETLIAGLLDELGVRDRVLLATKAGHVRVEDGQWDLDSSRAHLQRAVDASLQRLGVERIALWQHHRPDPQVDYAEVVETLKEIHDSGKVEMVGISNADPEQIRLAHRVLGDALASVQNQFSPAFRTSRPEIDLCEELGLAFLPWSPLGGLSSAKAVGHKHAAFAEVADARGVSPQRVTLAWALAQSPCVIPIPGAKRPSSIIDSAAAADLELTDDELARLDAD